VWRAPARRLLLWFALSLPALALVVWLNGPRPNLATVLGRPSFLAAEALALATALAAGYAALCAPIPGEPGWKQLLPLAAAAAWLGFLGKQCWDVYVAIGPRGLALGWDSMCIPAIALGGAVPALLMAALLRRGVGYRLTQSCLCGALAAAALAEAALRLYHPEDAALMVLVWQLGSVALFTALASLAGRIALADTKPAGTNP
ncbi:MAG: NrsF family protein, partial [Acetobacteraceae bacterium]